jgi:hypothetical protein
LTCSLFGSPSAFGQKEKSSATSPDSSQMTQVMDGGAGPCSLELSVSANGKPSVAAHVWVHIVYGFGGIRKLDLDAYTGNDGKLKFTGLPDRVKRPPLKFRAAKDQMSGTAVYDPETECKAKLDLVLTPQKTTEEEPGASVK